MGQHCPRCQAPLPWNQLKREFRCPNCGASLRSNVISIMSWAGIPVASAAFSLQLVAPEWTVYVGLAVGAVVIAAIGVAFGTVEALEQRDAT